MPAAALDAALYQQANDVVDGNRGVSTEGLNPCRGAAVPFWTTGFAPSVWSSVEYVCVNVCQPMLPIPAFTAAGFA
jgi:hypothetical protein